MSATGRSDVRHPDDFYATPAWATRAIVPHLREKPSQYTLDPCAGDGAILRAIGGGIGMEISPDRVITAETIRRDALTPEPWPFHTQVVTNPPYKLALAFVERALSERRANYSEIAMLLRLNWLASRTRSVFHRAHPSDVYVLPRRPSFTNGGTDATEYAWFVWGEGRGNRWFILDECAANLEQCHLAVGGAGA